MKHTFRSLVLLPALSMLVVSCAPLTDPQNGSSSSSSLSTSSGAVMHYSLRYHINNAAAMGLDPSLQSGQTSSYEMDAEIIELHPQGNPGPVVLASIKEAMPSLKDPFNKTLIVIAQPEEGTTVFTEALWQTDADVNSLYTFDASTSSFRAMNTSATFNNRAYGSAYKSPDDRFVAVIEKTDSGKDMTKVSVIDLATDNVVHTFTAPANRSVRRSSDMPFVSDITWTDSSTLRIGLYDTTVPYSENITPVDYADVSID